MCVSDTHSPLWTAWKGASQETNLGPGSLRWPCSLAPPHLPPGPPPPEGLAAAAAAPSPVEGAGLHLLGSRRGPGPVELPSHRPKFHHAACVGSGKQQLLCRAVPPLAGPRCSCAGGRGLPAQSPREVGKGLSGPPTAQEGTPSWSSPAPGPSPRSKGSLGPIHGALLTLVCLGRGHPEAGPDPGDRTPAGAKQAP